jgi:hypothetical protein
LAYSLQLSTKGADTDKLKAFLARVDEITEEEIEAATTATEGSAPEVDSSVDESYTPPLGAAVDANPKVFFDIDVAGTAIGRLVIELKADVAPKCVWSAPPLRVMRWNKATPRMFRSVASSHTMCACVYLCV